MADISTALKAIATANVALTALVGTRVHHGNAAQGSTQPYVTYFRISDIPERAMGATTRAGLLRSHWQFDIWADTMTSMKATAAAVLTAYEDYSGTSDTIVIDKILAEYGPEDTSEDIFHAIIEAWVHYRS